MEKIYSRVGGEPEPEPHHFHCIQPMLQIRIQTEAATFMTGKIIFHILFLEATM
jgi:hypothetical protein